MFCFYLILPKIEKKITIIALFTCLVEEHFFFIPSQCIQMCNISQTFCLKKVYKLNIHLALKLYIDLTQNPFNKKNAMKGFVIL